MSEAEVQRTLGELSASVAALRDLIIDNRHARQMELERLEGTIRGVNHEQRNAAMALQARLEVMDRNVTDLERQVSRLSNDLQDVKTDVKNVRAPVEALISYKERVGAMAFVIMGAAALIGGWVAPGISSLLGKLFVLVVRGQ